MLTTKTGLRSPTPLAYLACYSYMGGSFADRTGEYKLVLGQPSSERGLTLECRREPRRPEPNRCPIAPVSRWRLDDDHGEKHRPPFHTTIVQSATEHPNVHRLN